MKKIPTVTYDHAVTKAKPIIIGISRKGMMPGDTLTIVDTKITFVAEEIQQRDGDFFIRILPRSRDMARRLAVILRSIGYEAEQVGQSRRVKVFPRPAMIYSGETRLPFIPQVRAITRSPRKRG